MHWAQRDCGPIQQMLSGIKDILSGMKWKKEEEKRKQIFGVQRWRKMVCGSLPTEIRSNWSQKG